MKISAVIPAAFVVLAISMLGCSSSPPRPMADVTRARTLIQQAERSEAQRFAAADLNRARDGLRRSQAAVTAGNEEFAHRLSAEAVVDAELALARSSAAQAERSAAEVSASLDALRSESQRGLVRP